MNLKTGINPTASSSRGGAGVFRHGPQLARAFATILVVAGISACGSTAPQPTEPAPIETSKPAPLEEPVAVEEPAPAPIPEQPQVQQTEDKPIPPCVCPQAETHAGIIGEAEYVLIGERGLLQKARIDTGATTTSVGIAEMSRFERDGNKWLKFTIIDRLEGGTHSFERPLLRMVDIKQHGGEANRRPVVAMKVTIGDLTRSTEVTLADRDAFEFPVLIGRNFLDGNVLVDVSKRYIATTSTE